MLRYLFLFIVTIHGLIHLLGFLKAYQLAEIEQLTKAISRPEGLLWLLATVAFVAAAVLYLLGNGAWSVIALLAVILSQALIFFSWQDAKFGTIANVIVLLVAVSAFGAWQFERGYRQDVREGLQRTNDVEAELLTEADLAPLPEPVQRYLRYAGVVGKPKVRNFRAVFTGEMRSRTQDWFSFSAEQYNFFDDLQRLFFMKASVKGLPAQGYHRYKNGEASMRVKLFSLFPVANIEGEQMFDGETVTVFNDMCLMAPATLIDDRIEWEAIDDTSARAVFTSGDTRISALLYFNEEGQLVNFISDDRLEINDMKTYRFSTPVRQYENVNGYNLMTYGEAIWHYPEEEFVYGKFYLQSVEYNDSPLVR